MEALVLEPDLELNLRPIEIEERLGPHDVRVKLHTVGICGSDVHYYTHGRIGPFKVEQPMVLGHEASGVVREIGREVEHLAVGDRVCMEPGIPDPRSKASRLGLYNLDPSVRFWATPPVHGVLRPSVVHPAAFTYKLPEGVSFAEGAMVEPLAVGMQAAKQAGHQAGDLAVVIGAGPIGMVTILAALASGCSRVVVSDPQTPKLELAATLGPVTTVNPRQRSVRDVVDELTDGWGADVVYECSGHPKVAGELFEPLRPGGCVVYVGMPVEPISFDIVNAQVKEARIETVFRYANVFERALELMGSGRIDVEPLITDRFDFEESVKAFDFAADMPADSVKAQIIVDEAE